MGLRSRATVVTRPERVNNGAIQDKELRSVISKGKLSELATPVAQERNPTAPRVPTRPSADTPIRPHANPKEFPAFRRNSPFPVLLICYKRER